MFLRHWRRQPAGGGLRSQTAGCSPELAKIKVSSPQLPPQPHRAGEGGLTSLSGPAPSSGPPLRNGQPLTQQACQQEGGDPGEDKGGGAVYMRTGALIPPAAPGQALCVFSHSPAHGPLRCQAPQPYTRQPCKPFSRRTHFMDEVIRGQICNLPKVTEQIRSQTGLPGPVGLTSQPGFFPLRDLPEFGAGAMAPWAGPWARTTSRSPHSSSPPFPLSLQGGGAVLGLVWVLRPVSSRAGI